MSKRYLGKLTVGFCMLTLLVLSACAAATNGGTTRDYVSLVDNLRAAGATVEPAGSISQPFFSVEGNAINVNGENVQVFEYENDAAAKAEADTISPEGSTIGTSIVSWIGPPHFFQTGRIIVLYVGDNGEVIRLLTEVIGQQIAGR